MQDESPQVSTQGLPIAATSQAAGLNGRTVYKNELVTDASFLRRLVFLK